MTTHKKHRSSRAQAARRWTPLQKALGYTLLVVCFVSVLTYVSQGIEVKNVAYAMQDLIRQKRSLLDEKQRIQLSLLEQQSFDRVESLLDRFELPLEPGPRLEIVLRESFDNHLLFEEPRQDEKNDSWRGWLARMNHAHAMVTSNTRRSFGWKPSTGKQEGGTPSHTEGERR